MNYVHLLLIFSLAGLQVTSSAPTEERNNFFENIDYNMVVGHMKELLMYMPVLMTTIKETVGGFPRVSENVGSKRYLLGSGRQNDGKCRCRHVTSDSRSEESGY